MPSADVKAKRPVFTVPARALNRCSGSAFGLRSRKGAKLCENGGSLRITLLFLSPPISMSPRLG